MTQVLTAFTNLTEEQSLVAHDIIDYLQTGTIEGRQIDFLVLEGYAGTGKSYTLNRAIEGYSEFSKTNLNIAFSAPTHKAVRVLRLNSESPKSYMYGTIHSLLGLTQKVSDKGVISYEADLFIERKICGAQVLIVDEVSMLDPKLFEHIMDYKKGEDPKLRIIFTGDPLQIPPVGESQSYVFTEAAVKEYNVHRMLLSTPMRQAKDNPILDLATTIRQNIYSDVNMRDFNSFTEEEGVEILAETDSKTLDRILPMFMEEFEENQDFVKILAWTNAQVNMANRVVRNHRLGSKSSAKIVVGEYLIADKPIMSTNTLSKFIAVFNSEEMKVVECQTKSINVSFQANYGYGEMIREALKKCPEAMDEAQRQSWAESAVTKALVPASFQVVHPFNFYICRVEIYRPEAMDCDKNGNVTRTIQIIHEDSEETYQKFVARLKTVAFNAYSKKSAWREYSAFQDNFAQVRYNYALTVHKSQGSTYENCIVLLNDLNKNRKVIGGKDIKAEERNRIKYVAVSRAKKKLLVIM